jgi:riboflavin kinase/FMN adenylyltransferase
LKNNFNTTVINEHKYNGKKVSSSLLKEAFKDGDIKLVNKMLSRQYGVYGNVIVDQRLGNTIGFPTANILCTNQYIKYGVYVTNVLINGIIYKSITNVGIRPSVKDNSLRIETHIFDFNQDIYGKDIEVRFIDFIRNEVKFNSIEQLIEQIKKDVTFVKEYNGN